MAKRGKGPDVLQTVISNDNDWKKLCGSPGLWVIDVYKNWAGPCYCMVNELKKIKQTLADDLLRFAMADADFISDLAGYRDTCEPQWLFVAGGYKIALMTGVNAKALMKMIEEELSKERLVLQGKAMRKILEAPSKVAKVTEGEEDEEEREEMERAILSLKAYVDKRLLAKTVKVKRFLNLIVKSEVVKLNKVEEIRKLIEDAGIEVLAEKEIVLTESDAIKYFHHIEEQKFFTSFIKSIIGGPNVLFLLTKFAYGTLIFALIQDLLGPEKVEEAKKTHPDSLRARYGIQGFTNGLYASIKEKHAIKELEIFFPEIIQEQEKLKLGNIMPYQHSVIILKPVLLQSYEEDDIINDIKYITGCNPLFRREILFDETRATEFCTALISIDVNHFAVITDSFLGGPLVVLVYGGEDMIGIIMDCMGPDISAIAEPEEEDEEEDEDEDEEEEDEEMEQEEVVESHEMEEETEEEEGEHPSEIRITEPETGEEEPTEELVEKEEEGADEWFQERKPISLRLKYPVLIPKTTGIHCSTSDEEAFAELEFLFPALAMNVEAMMSSLSKGEFKLEQEEGHLNRVANAQQRLLLLIIPASFKRLGREFICVKIQILGFELVQYKAKLMKDLEVERFLQRVGVYPSQIQALIPSFTEGPCLLLNVTAENVIEKIKQLLGPNSPQQAHATQPDSLVAQFSLPGETISPIYCSTTRENIAKDILTFFSTMDDALTDDQVQDLFSPRPEGAPLVLKEEPRKPRARKGREKPGVQVEEKVEEKPQTPLGEEGLIEGAMEEATPGFEMEEMGEIPMEGFEGEDVGSVGTERRESVVEEAEGQMELTGSQQIISPNDVISALGVEGSSKEEKDAQMTKLGVLGIVISDYRTGGMAIDPDKLKELEVGTMTPEGQPEINKEKLDAITIPDPLSYSSEGEAKAALGTTDEQFDKLAGIEIIEINSATDEVTVNKTKLAQLGMGSFNPNTGKFAINATKLAKIPGLEETFSSPAEMMASLGLEGLPSAEQDQLVEKMVELGYAQVNSETNETTVNQQKLLQAGVTALNTQSERIELIPNKLTLATRPPSKAPSELHPGSVPSGEVPGEIPASLQKIEDLAINLERLGALGVICIQPETGHYIVDQDRVIKLQIASIQPVSGRFELNTARIAQLGIAQFQPEIRSYELDRERTAALGIVVTQPDEGYIKILPEKIHQLGIEIGKAGRECITISQQKLSELGIAIISAEEPSMPICKPGERAYSAEMRRMMTLPCIRRPCSAPVLGDVGDSGEPSLWVPPMDLPKLQPTPSGRAQTIEVLLENAVTLIVDKEFNRIIDTAIDIIAKALMEPPKNIECQKCRDELLRLYPPKPQIITKPYKQAIFPLDPVKPPEQEGNKLIQFDPEHFKMFLESSRKAAQTAMAEDTKIVERLQEPPP